MITDTDALIQTVREALTYWARRENPHAQIAGTHIDYANTALDALAAELERVKAERNELARKNERRAGILDRQQARLDKALDALREIRDLQVDENFSVKFHLDKARSTAHVALAEIEGEA